MNIIAFVGAGIIGAVLSSVLKQYKPEFSIYITLITGMLMLGAAISKQPFPIRHTLTCW